MKRLASWSESFDAASFVVAIAHVGSSNLVLKPAERGKSRDQDEDFDKWSFHSPNRGFGMWRCKLPGLCRTQRRADSRNPERLYDFSRVLEITALTPF